MNTKCIIICQSIYNDNTGKLAQAMAQTLGSRCVTVDEALGHHWRRPSGKARRERYEKSRQVSTKNFPRVLYADYYLLLQNAMEKGFHFTKSRIT